MTDTKTYDFIIIGAGASGCALAHKLIYSPSRPTVLLLEAGGANDNPHHSIDHDKFVLRLVPELTWGYQSIPQPQLDGRVVPLDRGKGLGGSTAVNFSVWDVGPRDDMVEMVRRTSDEDWSWENVLRLLHQAEDFRGPVQTEVQDYLSPDLDKHGSKGSLKIGFPKVWEKNLTDMIDLFTANGWPVNKDCGTGSNLGIGVVPNTAFDGHRTSAKDFLTNAPNNLTIETNAQVARINITSPTNKAVSVTTLDNRTFHASKEIIISAGTLDSPRLLMHSGIGPESQLSQYNIPLVRANDHVGQHLRDHCHVAPIWERADHTSIRPAFFRDPSARATALKQWESDRTGPLAEIFCQLAMGYTKSPAILGSAEFARLPTTAQEFLNQPTIGSYEIILNPPCSEYYSAPTTTPALESVMIFLQNGQSTGSATLQSSDPAVPLSFDPKLLSHEYDKRVAIESVREVFRVTESPAFQKDTVRLLNGPASMDEEDILAYWRKELVSTWHMSGTCRIARDEEDGVVDGDFKVFGTQGLRVVDMSIMPIIVNNHTTTTAVTVGLLAGEKICREYGL